MFYNITKHWHIGAKEALLLSYITLAHMSPAYIQGQIVDNELTNQSVRVALSCYKISLVASAVSNCSKVLYFHVHLLIYCFPCPCIASSAVDAFNDSCRFCSMASSPHRVCPLIDSTSDQVLKIHFSVTEKKGNIVYMMKQNHKKHVYFLFLNPLKVPGKLEIGSLEWVHRCELSGGEHAMGKNRYHFFYRPSTINQRTQKTEFSIWKKHQMFFVHTIVEELKSTTITGYFGFVFDENSGTEITWLS